MNEQKKELVEKLPKRKKARIRMIFQINARWIYFYVRVCVCFIPLQRTSFSHITALIPFYWNGIANRKMYLVVCESHFANAHLQRCE